MIRRFLPVLAPFVAAAGCTSQPNANIVPDAPFGFDPMKPTPHVACSPATAESAARVEAVRQRLLTANPQLGIQPLIATVGKSEPEIFHQGTTNIVLTEGLVKQCPEDRQLAAVLSLELGKMIADREAQAPRRGARQPAMDLPIGANGGLRGWADHTDQAEIWKLNADRPSATAAAGPAPEPKQLARGYLEKAGYAQADLDDAGPMLKAAAENNGLAKTFAGQGK